MSHSLSLDEIKFESQLGPHSLPYLEDHRIQDIVVLPVAAYLEMALAAAVQAFGAGTFTLTDVVFHHALLLPEGSIRTVQIILSPEAFGEATFQVFSLPIDGEKQLSQRALHATGKIHRDRPLSAVSSMRSSTETDLQFSLFYFGSSEAAFTKDRYDLLVEGAKFADSQGFTAVWTPERHFHSFGGSYPSPAVLSAALAMVTERVRLRAGSVVLPLHHPIQVAEEWSVVDNLSRGRVDISFASGWHVDDFVFSPQLYADRKQVMFSKLDSLRRFWRGESMFVEGGGGKTTEVKLFPMPMQRELPVWLTIIKNPESYVKAGEIGANVLTNLLSQTTEELAKNIKLYRDSLAKNGYDPQRGQVTLLLHTFIGEDIDFVREKVRAPFCNYLRSTIGIIHNLVKSLDLNLDIESLTPTDIDDLLSFAFERYFQMGSLLGTPTTCLQMIDLLKEIGVSEVGCFIDFGVDFDSAMASLHHLNVLREVSLGRVETRGSFAVNQDSLMEIQSRCVEEISAATHYQALRDRGFQHGPSLQTVRHLWRHNGEALGQLQLPPMLEAEAGVYQVHPIALDAGLQVLAAALPSEDDRIAGEPVYLPTGLGSLRIHGRVSSQMWSHCLLQRTTKLNPNTFMGDVRLLDESARVVVEALGLRVQRVGRVAQGSDLQALSDLLYEPQWEPKPHVEMEQRAALFPTTEPGSWLIFADSLGIGQMLAVLLAARGESCVMVSPGEAYEISEQGHFLIDPSDPEQLQQLLKDAFGPDQRPCRGVVHLWSLGATPPEETTLTSLDTAQALGCETVLHVVQVLTGVGWPVSPNLWVVTRGAQSVPVEGGPVSVAQSPLWGLGRVIAIEHPELRCVRIDLEPSAGPKDVQSLFEELWLRDNEDQVAFRSGQRYVMRLLLRSSESMPRKLPQALAPTPFRSSGTYLITGGLGGLGLLLARWMVRRGARHLALLGRRGASSSESDALDALRASGAEVIVIKADIAEAGQVANALTEIERSLPPIRGIVHAASVIEDSVLLQLDNERFTAAMRPKVNGAWNLHTLTLSKPLDFFVLFSSAASILGSAGQGNYVSANAFLDALSHYRRSVGLPSLTINWGRWAEASLEARPDLKEHLFLRGMCTIAPEQALLALEQLLQQDSPQVVVMSVDWPQVLRSYPTDIKPALLSHLSIDRIGISQSEGLLRRDGGIDRERILALDSQQRQSKLESHLQNLVAGVLRLAPSQVDLHQPLNTLGLDSLMAIEIKNAIQTGMGVVLPLVSLLKEPTVTQLATKVLEKLTASSSVADDEKIARMLKRVEQLSGEQAKAMLDYENLIKRSKDVQ